MRRLAGVLLAAACGATPAANDEGGRGKLLPHDAYRPAALALATEDRAYLGYAIDELPRVQRVEINGDGIPDSFVIAADVLYGTGGCPVLLLEGRSGHRLGEFFGAVAVLARRRNGHALIQVASRRDIERSNLETHAFEQGSYRLADHRLLDASGMAAWRAALEGRP